MQSPLHIVRIVLSFQVLSGILNSAEVFRNAGARLVVLGELDDVGGVEEFRKVAFRMWKSSMESDMESLGESPRK